MKGGCIVEDLPMTYGHLKMAFETNRQKERKHKDRHRQKDKRTDRMTDRQTDRIVSDLPMTYDRSHDLWSVENGHRNKQTDRQIDKQT